MMDLNSEGSNDRVLEKSYTYNEISELTRVNDLEKNVIKVYNYEKDGKITDIELFKNLIEFFAGLSEPILVLVVECIDWSKWHL